MDLVLRIGGYIIVGAILLTLNGLYLRRLYHEFHRIEPSPVIAPFRIVGIKDDPERGKALAQMLIARVDQLNDELSEAMKVLNETESSQTETAATPSGPKPEDIRFESTTAALDDVPFGEFEAVDVNLSFGGVELGGLVSWAQKIAMSDRVMNISVQYDGPKTTVAMTPNRANRDSIWLELNGSDDRALITDLAYAFIKRGWESDDEDIRKLTLAEFKTLTRMIVDAATVKRASKRSQPDLTPLEKQIDVLLTPQSRAWESQRILKMCAIIAEIAGNNPRAAALYGLLQPKDEKDSQFIDAALNRLPVLLTDPRTAEVLVAVTPMPAAPAPVQVGARPPEPQPAASRPAATTTAAAEPAAPAQTATAEPEPVAPSAPAVPTPAPVSTERATPPAAYFMRGSADVLKQLHVPDGPMEGEPLVAVIGPDPDPRVGQFDSAIPGGNASPQMTEYSTHLIEFVRLVAPRSRAVFIDVNPTDPSDIARAAEEVQRRKAAIVLLTYGPLSPTVEKIFASMADRGVLVVSAAGNRGRGFPTNFAAASHRVLVVSAADNRGRPAHFTQSSDDSVWAPGTGFPIASLHGQLTERSGTSYAAALAAGVAARVLAVKPDMKPADVIKLLRHTSKPAVSGGPPLINASEAITVARRSG